MSEHGCAQGKAWSNDEDPHSLLGRLTQCPELCRVDLLVSERVTFADCVRACAKTWRAPPAVEKRLTCTGALGSPESCINYLKDTTPLSCGRSHTVASAFPSVLLSCPIMYPGHFCLQIRP